MVDVDKSSNQVSESNIANLSFVLGAGIDTLLGVGAGPTIDAGAAEFPNVIAPQYKLRVQDNYLFLSDTDKISLAGDGFVQSGKIDGVPGSTSLIIANGYQTISVFRQQYSNCGRHERYAQRVSIRTKTDRARPTRRDSTN